MISIDDHVKWKKWSARGANTNGRGNNKNISKRTTLSGNCLQGFSD